MYIYLYTNAVVEYILNIFLWRKESTRAKSYVVLVPQNSVPTWEPSLSPLVPWRLSKAKPEQIQPTEPSPLAKQ